MQKNDKRLGRGLDALIPVLEETAREAVPTGVSEIPVSEIVPNPHQPRTGFDPVALAELSDSIKEHGVLQPIVVVKEKTGYELISGERRLRAAKAAGLTTIPALVRTASEQDKVELALVENVQRAELNPIDLCYAYKKLIDDFGLTQEHLADRVGKSRVAVANCLRLSSLPKVIQEGLARGAITEGHARALLALRGAKEQIALYELIVAEGLSVRETERRVQGFMPERQLPKEKKRALLTPLSLEEQEIARGIQEKLGAKTAIVRSGKGGKIVLEFYSDEELTRLYDAITKKK